MIAASQKLVATAKPESVGKVQPLRGERGALDMIGSVTPMPIPYNPAKPYRPRGRR